MTVAMTVMSSTSGAIQKLLYKNQSEMGLFSFIFNSLMFESFLMFTVCLLYAMSMFLGQR